MVSRIMKPVTTLLLIICMLCISVASFADFNVNDYSASELAKIYSVVSQKIFDCIKVPVGLYIVGKDLPAGTYTVLTSNETPGNTTGDFSHVAIFGSMDEYEQNPDNFFNEDSNVIIACNTLWNGFSYELSDGMVLVVKYGKAGITKVDGNIFSSFWNSDGIVETEHVNEISQTQEEHQDTNDTSNGSGPSPLSVFHSAEYSVYNMKASENGLEGDLLLLEGTIVSYNDLSGTEYVVLQQDDGNQWMIVVGQTISNGKISGKKYESTVDKSVKVYCTYMGFSGAVKLPACNIMSYGGMLLVEENEFLYSSQSEIIMNQDGISVDDFVQ